MADMATDILLERVWPLQKHISAICWCLMLHWKLWFTAASHHIILADTDRRAEEDLEKNCASARPFSPENLKKEKVTMSLAKG